MTRVLLALHQGWQDGDLAQDVQVVVEGLDHLPVVVSLGQVGRVGVLEPGVPPLQSSHTVLEVGQGSSPALVLQVLVVDGSLATSRLLKL